MRQTFSFRPLFFSFFMVFALFGALERFRGLPAPASENPSFATSLPVDQNPTLSATGTYYFIPQLKHQEGGVDLLDGNEQPTGFKLSLCDWCKAAIEGTVAINKNGKTTLLNFKTRSTRLVNDCRSCPRYKNYTGYDKTGRVLWQISSGFGLGTKGYKLVPYRSVAVDPNVIPLGSVVFIPAAAGIKIAEAGKTPWTHDGYFFAADVGSKIVGDKMDFFLGFSTTNPFPFVTSNAKDKFSVEIVRDPRIVSKYAAMHGK
ncbi:MAG: 3D domain-containing protein [Saprospiraceae bacterium]|jgi:3D (Asp-Asp-Asp) domain-containing protein